MSRSLKRALLCGRWTMIPPPCIEGTTDDELRDTMRVTGATVNINNARVYVRVAFLQSRCIIL